MTLLQQRKLRLIAKKIIRNEKKENYTYSIYTGSKLKNRRIEDEDGH
jgi:hypothetical protein